MGNMITSDFFPTGFGASNSGSTLLSLLPGLLTFTIVRALTSKERKLDAVEAVIFGLTYTFIAWCIWGTLCLRSWIPTPTYIGLPIVAISMGIVISLLINYDLVFSRL